MLSNRVFLELIAHCVASSQYSNALNWLPCVPTTCYECMYTFEFVCFGYGTAKMLGVQNRCLHSTTTAYLNVLDDPFILCDTNACDARKEVVYALPLSYVHMKVLSHLLSRIR